MLEGVKRYPVPFEKAARIVIGCDEFVDRMKLFPDFLRFQVKQEFKLPRRRILGEPSMESRRSPLG